MKSIITLKKYVRERLPVNLMEYKLIMFTKQNFKDSIKRTRVHFYHKIQTYM